MEEKILHLSEIQNPINCGENIRVEGVVASSSLSYLVPRKARVWWIPEASTKPREKWPEIKYGSADLIKFVGISEGQVRNLLVKLWDAPKKAHIDIEAYWLVYKLRVRPPVFTLEESGGKIVDEAGLEYKPYDVYVLSAKPLSLVPATKVIFEGRTLPDPKSQKATFLSEKTTFPDSVGGYDKEALLRLRGKLEPLTVSQRVDWILRNFELYSNIVGRRNIAYAALLSFFTPVWLSLNGDNQRGWGLILIIGDTTTGKSESVLKLIQLLRGGTLITAETASAVGLTGAAIQVEGGEWFTDWGFLPLNNERLLAIDGAQKLSLRQWATLAEAERRGIVIKATAAKGQAPARTRQIKIANPVDPDLGKYTTKRISSFLHPILSAATVLDKTSIARLDLVAISDERTVKPEDVNRLKEEVHDPDLELLREVLKWTWSGQAEIHFTPETVDLILKEATRLYQLFHSPTIPLVDVNMKWKLARLSASLAALTLSTSPAFDIIKIEPDHVREIVSNIEKEYTNAGLNALARSEEYEVIDEEEATDIITTIANSISEPWEQAVEILRWMVVKGGFTRGQIMEQFHLSERNQLRPLIAVMKNLKLIKTGRGFTPLPRLIELYRLLEDPESSAKIAKTTKSRIEPPSPQSLHATQITQGYPLNPKIGKLGNLGKTAIPRRP